MANAGATITVDGIAARPTYDYTPPQSFFDGSDIDPSSVLDVRNFGATADPAIDNRAAIQSAIDAAHAAGGGTVYVPAGVYGVLVHPTGNGSIYLHSNVFLIGDGIGETVLRVMDGSSDRITGIVRTPSGEATTNYGLADLTLDGNRANTTGKVDAFYTGGTPGKTIADEDAWVLRVEAANASGYGFDPHEQTHRLTIADSVAHHNGLDGFVADFLVDSVYSGNLAYENDRHGFNIVTSTNDMLLSNNISRDNGDSGIVVQRGSENIPSPGNILIEGGEISGNAREGVRIQMADDVLVRGVDIHDNGTYGIRLLGSSNVSVIDTVLTDNSRSSDGSYSAVQIRDYDDTPVSGKIYDGQNNVISQNVIKWTDDLSGSYGIEEKSGATGHSQIVQNSITGDLRSAYQIAASTTEIKHSGTESADAVKGGPGNDTIAGLSGADDLRGGAGDDFISGDRGGDKLFGDDGNDTLYGRDGDDTVSGGNGNDWISGGKGTDTLSGGAGDDIIFGNTGVDTIFGDAGNDQISGNDGNDVIDGGAGHDVISGGKGVDHISGGEGDDRIAGNSNADVLYGGAGNDTLEGNSGNDQLFGGDGDDTLIGGTGTDRLTGGKGDDRLTGNSGYDDFVIAPGDGNDIITDFTPGEDDLDLSAFAIGSFENLLPRITETANHNLRIALDANTSVVLEGVTLDKISQSDFIF